MLYTRGDTIGRDEAVMRQARRLMTWAVDGPGSRFQGRPAIGIAAAVMLLPLVLNAVAMAVFGYGRGSPAYGAMIGLIVVCWAIAICYLLALLAFALFRMTQELWQALRRRLADRPVSPDDRTATVSPPAPPKSSAPASRN